MKKITLLILVMLLSVMGVNAKTKTTTLWEGTDTGADIEVSMSELVKGATLNLTFNWLGSDGAHFSCFWWDSSKGDSGDWVRIRNWEWVNNGESFSFTLTDGEFDAITNDKLCFKTEASDKMTIAKITQIETLVPTSTGDNLLSENWTASWTAKTFAAQSSAKIGDVIRFSYSAPGSWNYFQFNILDAYGNADAFENTSSNFGKSIETAADLYFDFEITNISDLQKIQNEGFGIKGENFTLTSVQLLTYADSYDAVSITVGSDGIATYSNGNKNVQISDCAELKAYYASAVAEGSVTLTEITCIPASQGAIVKGAAGTYTVKVGGEGWEDLSSKNYLKPSNGGTNVAASTEGSYHYIFAKKGEGTPSFYKLTANHTLAAHKAYLETPTDITPTGARMALIFSDDETTGINNVNVNYNDNWYDMQGRKVKATKKGLYIVNGRKVVIK